jgi:hypothetical protein
MTAFTDLSPIDYMVDSMAFYNSANVGLDIVYLVRNKRTCLAKQPIFTVGCLAILAENS